MSGDLIDVTLEQIDGGRLSEKFNESLRDVIENIHDPKTKVREKREINIKISISPKKDDRGKCTMVTSCTTKLARAKDTDSMFYCGVDVETGEVGAKQKLPEQPSLFDNLPKPQERNKNIVGLK